MVGTILYPGDEEPTTSQALYPTSPAILASFEQTRTDISPLLARVPNPNIGSGSYSSHELITAAASLWLPTAFCLQGCLQSLLSGTKDSQFTSARLFQAWPEAYPPDVPRPPETTAT